MSTGPPLRSLPTPATCLINREHDVAAVRQRLCDPHCRVLTLTGPPGIGKTRLALAIGDILADAYDDGVCFVSLAAIRDPALVISAIAQALGLREGGGQPLVDTLIQFLRDRRLLLILDNFEHLAPAAAQVADLLSACAALTILATSRAPLDVYGEHEWALAPLALPARGRSDGPRPPAPSTPETARSPTVRTADASSMASSPAVALFFERAGAVRPEFVPADDNVATVAEICHRLDGLPLAIELAAARIRLLPPAAMLARLERRLPLLTGGARDQPARHQTLSAAIAWSYDLLDPSEQRLFRRLALFVGGCTLETAEAVCGDEPGLAVLDGLTSLVAKSLVRHQESPSVDGEPRFVMLGTIREFGVEQLEASDEATDLRRRYARYFLELAETADPHLRGPDQVRWLDRLDVEHDNLRAALAWSLNEAGERADAAHIALRLGAALARFWFQRGHVSEGRSWMEGVLERSIASEEITCSVSAAGGDAPAPADESRRTADRARALFGAGRLAFVQADYAAARAFNAGSAAVARELDDGPLVAYPLIWLSALASYEDRHDEAERLGEQSVEILRAAGDQWGLALAINGRGARARSQGDYEAARAAYEESATLFRETGDRWALAVPLVNLAHVALLQGDAARAAELFKESLTSIRAIEEKWFIARCMEGLAGVACALGDWRRGPRLIGAAEALREAVGAPPYPADREAYERTVAALRAQLGEQALEQARKQGLTMAPERAIAYALEPIGAPAESEPLPTPGGQLALLSRREREVARLVAQGLTNRQIAEALVVGERTSESHVASVLNKLGLHSRAQVAAWAVSQGLQPPS